VNLKGTYTDRIGLLIFGEPKPPISIDKEETIDHKHPIDNVTDIFAESAILLNDGTTQQKAESFAISYRMCK